MFSFKGLIPETHVTAKVPGVRIHLFCSAGTWCLRQAYSVHICERIMTVLRSLLVKVLAVQLAFASGYACFSVFPEDLRI